MIVRLISPAGTRVETSDSLAADLVKFGYKQEGQKAGGRQTKKTPAAKQGKTE